MAAACPACFAEPLPQTSFPRSFPPNPCYPPLAFYSSVRLGDPEQLAKIMDTDPYFVTQDNGAGAPLHFATTYRQLDMVRAAGGWAAVHERRGGAAGDRFRQMGGWSRPVAAQRSQAAAAVA